LLSVFQAAQKSGKDRMFWSNQDRTFSYVGIGVATKIIVDESNRYEGLEKQWNALLNQAIIHNPYKVNGTGLLGIGGMSFDPRKKSTALWEQFPSSQLTVPAFFVVETEGRYFMTVNQEVEASDDAEEVTGNMKESQQFLQTIRPLQKSTHTILNK